MSRIRIAHDEIAARVLDGEAVIINLSTGLYYSLEGSGALAWEHIERGASADELAAALSRAYGIDADRARSDVAALIAELKAEELVREAGDGEPGPADAVASGGFGAGGRPYAAPKLVRYSDMERFFALDPPLPDLDDEGE